MDEHTDNQQRRMLFTDFDVSDKGRPAAVITPEPPPGYYTAPLHSIAELASSIELDFEDDDGGVSSGRATATATATATEADDDDGADAEGRTKRIPHFAIPGDDQELSLDPADTVAAVAAPTPLPAIAIPTWEEFAKAFRSAQETPAGEEGRETGGANASAPDAATAPAPARPGAALTADEDGNIVHRSTPTAAYDPITDDDGDVDILSYFSGPNETGVFTSRDRRSVAPPPLVPYGGIERIEDWFSPPENQPEMHPASRDWFEPPEEAPPPAAEKAAAEETTVAAPENLGDLFDTVIFADGDLDQRISATTRRVDKPLSEKTAEGETGLDIFSGLDVESVWGDRLRQNHPRSHTGGDTGSLDMFSDIDLESMWNSRRGKRVTSDSARRFADDAMAQDRAGAGSDQSSDTVIFRRDPMNASDTVLVDRDEFFPPPASPAERSERPPAARPPSARVYGGVELPDDDDDVLMDLDNLSQEYLRSSGRTGDVDPDQTGSFAAVDDAGAMDEAEDAVRSDVRPPVIDDSDILTIVAGREEQEPEEIADDFDAFGDDAVAAPLDAAGMTEEDAEAGYGPEEEEGEEQYAAADMANYDEFGDEGVNADISPPVIGDSDIDTTRPGPRPGTEEMQAIMGESGGDAADVAEADVAVNPMDVFANMDDMDFSDDMDDDMRAMLDEDDAAIADIEGDNALVDNPMAEEAVVETPPDGFLGKTRFHLRRSARRVLPMTFIKRVEKMVAWSENWWFYCDLLAAIIASASLAVIISYYVWFT